MSVWVGVWQATQVNPLHLNRKTKETALFLLTAAVWQWPPAPLAPDTQRALVCQAVTVVGGVTTSPVGPPQS